MLSFTWDVGNIVLETILALEGGEDLGILTKTYRELDSVPEKMSEYLYNNEAFLEESWKNMADNVSYMLAELRQARGIKSGPMLVKVHEGAGISRQFNIPENRSGRPDGNVFLEEMVKGLVGHLVFEGTLDISAGSGSLNIRSHRTPKGEMRTCTFASQSNDLGISQSKNVREKKQRIAGESKQKQSEGQYANAAIDRACFESMFFGSWKGKPIEWLILKDEDGRRLLLSRWLLEERRFSSFIRSRWKYSEIRAWLNGEFFRKSFSPEEQKKVIRKKVFLKLKKKTVKKFLGLYERVVDEKVPLFDEVGVFLLSTKEVSEFFKSDEEKICRFIDGAAKYWWLRSPAPSDNAIILGAAGVVINGVVFSHGSDVIYPGGVRPALWLNM